MRRDTIDLTGKKFVRLKVISQVRREGKRGAFWRCICDCGNESIVYGGHLRNGHRKSCGCICLDKIDESAKKALFGRYLYKSKKRKINFELTRDVFDILITSNCFYCKKDPFQNLKNTTDRITSFYTGIDRIDSSLGYIKENCVSCCKICNVMKQQLTIEEWFSHMIKIIENWNDE